MFLALNRKQCWWCWNKSAVWCFENKLWNHIHFSGKQWFVLPCVVFFLAFFFTTSWNTVGKKGAEELKSMLMVNTTLSLLYLQGLSWALTHKRHAFHLVLYRSISWGWWSSCNRWCTEAQLNSSNSSFGQWAFQWWCDEVSIIHLICFGNRVYDWRCWIVCT